MNKTKELFRKEALQKLNISNHLNRRLNIVSNWSWLIAYAIGLIFLTLIIWGFLGSIPTRVQGEGILLAYQGGLYNAFAPEGNGRIISIIAKPGDKVKKNEIIARLDVPDLVEKINVAQNYLAKLQNEFSDLKNRYEIEVQINTQQINEQNKALEKIIVSQTEKLKYFSNFLEIKKNAFKKGLLTQDSVAITAQSYYEAEDTINQAQKNLEENKLKQSNFISQWNERITAFKLRVEEQEYQVNNMLVKLNSAKEVKSPISGVLTNIQVSLGEKVEGGQVVATGAAPY